MNLTMHSAERVFTALRRQQPDRVPVLEFVLGAKVAANAQTRQFVNADRLGPMKPTSMLINTARGSVLDESALYDALSSGRLADGHTCPDFPQQELTRIQELTREKPTIPDYSVCRVKAAIFSGCEPRPATCCSSR